MIGLAVAVVALVQMTSAAILPPVTLAWNQNPESDIAGYDLSYGTESGNYETTISAGLNTSVSVSGLSEGVTYYFVVFAYNTAGLRSLPSAEISYERTNQAPNSTISSPSFDTSITAGGVVSFAGSGSDPDDDTSLSYQWNFGSGSGVANSTAQNPGSRQFNTPGIFVVEFTVTDSLGLADSSPAQRTITVLEPPPSTQGLDGWIDTPSANISIAPGETVNFTGGGTDSSGGTRLIYRWSFGSGSGITDSTLQNPGARQFDTLGIYEVTLTVAERTGLADSTPARRTITVTNTVEENNLSPTLASWISGFNVGGETGVNGDFDGDGLGNAVENILGSNPAVHNVGLTGVSSQPNSLTFRHTQSSSPASNLTPGYEWSTDLVTWYPDGGSNGSVTVSFSAPSVIAAGSPETVQATATATGGTAVNLFVRLKAAYP